MSRVRPLAALLLALAAVISTTAAGQDPTPTSPPKDDPTWAVQITSPLGRTGVVTRVRIVAQIAGAAHAEQPVRASFYVDGQLLGEVSAPPYSVEWLDDNPFLQREIVVQAQDATGRSASDKVVLPGFQITDQSEVTSVLVEAGVYDKQGRFASNLDPATFVVRENGVAQKTESIAKQSVPTTIVLLVDNSQSMSRRIDFVRWAAERLGETLRKHDKIIVVPFNKQLGAITGPTSDARTISDAIAAMKAQGGTAILDGLMESMKLFESAEGRRVVIVITDGYDEHSAGDLDSTIKTAQDQQVAVYVVGIGGVAGISLKGEQMLRQLADKTGGRVHFPSRESLLGEVSEAVSTDVFSRYLISYTPSDRNKDGTWRAISIDVPEGYRVRAREGYYAPKPPPIRPTLEFTVMNESHQLLDIAVGDLEIVEDGAVQKVDTFQEAVEPVSIVMAIDASGSMVKSADAMREAARKFVSAVRPEDSLALITFADRPVFAHTLGKNRQFSFDAIDTYKPYGGTALYDALYNSLMTLKGVQGRRAIVVLTDGRDEDNPGTGPGSEHSFDDVLNVLRTVDATVFPIGLGTRTQRDFLEQLAVKSGGQAYFPSDITELDEQYRSVIDNLRRRYVLSYTSSNSTHDGAWRNVEIRSRIAGLKIATRGGYFAPQQ